MEHAHRSAARTSRNCTIIADNSIFFHALLSGLYEYREVLLVNCSLRRVFMPAPFNQGNIIILAYEVEAKKEFGELLMVFLILAVNKCLLLIQLPKN